MNRPARLLRATASAAALLFVLVALPVALWHLGRPLLPDELPSREQIVEALTRPDDGSLLIGLLVLIGATAWLVLAVSILAELASVALRRPVLQIGLPGFRFSRGVAATLVAALLGLGGAPALAAPAAATTAVTAPDRFDPGSTADEPTPEGPVHTVADRDTLWRIAERELGDPLRWREIYDLNKGRPQPDGGILTEASLLHAGWTLVLPADTRPSTPRATVTPGDTLGGIAQDRLGSPDHADEIFQANRGRPQADGQVLTDPDVIHPGWILTIPAPVEPSPPAPPPTPTTVPPPPSSSVVPTTPIRPVPPEALPSEPAPPDDADQLDGAALPVALVASSIVVGGVISALAVRRRRQLRARPAGHRIAVPSDQAGRLEWIGSHQPPPAVDIAFVDAGLRSLTLTDWTDRDLPQLRSVQLSPDAAVLTLAADAALPDPFASRGAATEWGLVPSAALPLAPDEVGGYCAPFPLLVSVATDPDDATLLLDLEQLGVIALTGPSDRTTGLLRHVAAELANSRWAEDVEVLMVGFGTELVALNPERLCSVPDLATGLEEIRLRIRAAQASVRQLPIDSVLDGRMRDIAADAWLPVALLAAVEPSPDERDAIAGLADEFATQGRLAAVVVITADVPRATTIDVANDGALTLTDVNGGPWTAESMTEETGAGLAAILTPTGHPHPEAGPAAERHQRWAVDMNSDGSLAPVTTPATEVGADPDPASGPASTGAPALRPVPQPAPDPEAVRRLTIVDHQDPDLDEDLRRWTADGKPAVPLIAILGNPEVRAPGELPSARPGWFTEVLVYLSLHPAGVSIPKALTDLWPEGKRVSVATVRHAFYGARRWAGRGLDGDPAATFVSDMQHDSTYRIRGHLLDWDLFRRLRKRAQARAAAHHPGAVSDYRAALDLVRGPVLSGLRHAGYAWLNNHDQRHDLQIPGFIVDAAHELVDLALATGDTALARHAAETARSIDIDVAFDRPLTDLMRIAHAEDNPSEMERYAEILLDARDFDVPEELPPETFAVLDELMPNGPRRRRP
ncbi:LysM peptidoglycan-binding domain-containing protein [Pseudonocardia lacus]|uniref:LysM peptidoglycan-binding domain-containing protein n=1 Tax=Pseudonocardia lacus TaxID=2835865 RepID=UPI001BDC24E9|nr:LysM peptidoglycan-binding domain-containing protein [Pseudonocardia lacus]